MPEAVYFVTAGNFAAPPTAAALACHRFLSAARRDRWATTPVRTVALACDPPDARRLRARGVASGLQLTHLPLELGHARLQLLDLYDHES